MVDLVLLLHSMLSQRGMGKDKPVIGCDTSANLGLGHKVVGQGAGDFGRWWARPIESSTNPTENSIQPVLFPGTTAAIRRTTPSWTLGERAEQQLGPPVVSFYPFLQEGVPNKISHIKKGTLILTSLLEDLDKICSALPCLMAFHWGRWSC